MNSAAKHLATQQSEPQSELKEQNLLIKNVDREGHELRVGDRVGFIMRGWFQPREQESFGLITAIDERGGIHIDVIESYRRFTSSGRIGAREKTIFFTHHAYDPVKRERRYSIQEGPHLLSIIQISPDELERHLREAQEAAAQQKSPEHAAARATTRKGL